MSTEPLTPNGGGDGSRPRRGAASAPIDAFRDAIVAALRPGASVLLTAEPGAGKTTRVPLWLLEADDSARGSPNGAGAVWWLTAPRRMAARAAAERLAASLGERVGQRVGLHTRDDFCVAAETRLLVMTEGAALRRLVDDPALEGVAGVMLDEFHERSATLDVMLALLRHSRALFNERLCLVLMSASVDGDALARKWSSGARVGAGSDAGGGQGSPPPSATDAVIDGGLVRLDLPGRGHPLRVHHVDSPLDVRTPVAGLQPDDVVARVVEVVSAALAGRLRDEDGEAVTLDHPDAPGGGDVLVFLPGLAEIRRLAAALERVVPPRDTVCTLHSGTPPAQQRAIVAGDAPDVGDGPGSGESCGVLRARRRWILATDVAETSLTIDGVRTVIDPGLHRRPRFDPNVGFTRLETRWITQANAIQRAGRAGRSAPGRVLRLYSQARFRRWPRTVRPALLEADLADTALALAAYGAEPDALDWLDAPSAGAFAQARDLLRRFAAIDDRGCLTPHGRRLWAAATTPRLAQLVLAAADAPTHDAGATTTRPETGPSGADVGSTPMGASSRPPGVAGAPSRAAVIAAARLAALLEEPPPAESSGLASVDLREALAALGVSGPGLPARDASTLAELPGATRRRLARRTVALVRRAVAPAVQRQVLPDDAFAPLALDAAAAAALDTAMVRAFPDRVVLSEAWLTTQFSATGGASPRASGASRRFRRPNGRWLTLRGAPGAVTMGADAVAGVAVEVADATSAGGDARIGRFWPLSARALLRSPDCTTVRTHVWNAEAGRVEAWLETRLECDASPSGVSPSAAGRTPAGLCLARRRVAFDARDRPEVERVLAEGAKAALSAHPAWLDGDERPAGRIVARLRFLRRVFGEAPVEGVIWPDVSLGTILGDADASLAPAVVGRHRLDELVAADPWGAWPIGFWLTTRDSRYRALLDRLAPSTWTLPSGRSVPIAYDALANPPAARVAGRVQEWFGTRETPTVAAGRVPLIIELCSPAGRPAAVTRDLARFWAQGYHDVRKALRGRYPKHPWPDDPLGAAPTQQAKPRRT